MKKVTLITGPGGSGKSTIAELLVQKTGAVWLDGDDIDTEFFPHGGQWDKENSALLIQTHNKILEFAQKFVSEGKSVIVDYIIFDHFEEYFSKFKQAFGDDLDIKILLPRKEVIIARNNARTEYQTGVDKIIRVYDELEKLRIVLGNDVYIDTSDETGEETAQCLV